MTDFMSEYSIHISILFFIVLMVIASIDTFKKKKNKKLVRTLFGVSFVILSLQLYFQISTKLSEDKKMQKFKNDFVNLKTQRDMDQIVLKNLKIQDQQKQTDTIDEVQFVIKTVTKRKVGIKNKNGIRFIFNDGGLNKSYTENKCVFEESPFRGNVFTQLCGFRLPGHKHTSILAFLDRIRDIKLELNYEGFKNNEVEISSFYLIFNGSKYVYSSKQRILSFRNLKDPYFYYSFTGYSLDDLTNKELAIIK